MHIASAKLTTTVPHYLIYPPSRGGGGGAGKKKNNNYVREYYFHVQQKLIPCLPQLLKASIFNAGISVVYISTSEGRIFSSVQNMSSPKPDLSKY